MAVDHDALANAHMTTQVKQAAVVQAALSRLWEQTLDPSDIAGSFTRFVTLAQPYIGAGRTLSERTAFAYLNAVKAVAGLGPADAIASELLDADILRKSMYGASGKALGRAISLDREGRSTTAALAIARGMMLGAAKRHVLNGGRGLLVRGSQYDSDLIGWARVSDGAPCSFCAMLVSRGPDYRSDTSARFRAHDRCGCSVRPIPYNDPTGGWSPAARTFQSLWDSDGGDAPSFRSAIDAMRGPLALAA